MVPIFYVHFPFFFPALACPETYTCVDIYRQAKSVSFWNEDRNHRCDTVAKLYACFERQIPRRCFNKVGYVDLLREKYDLRDVLTDICRKPCE